MTSCGLTITEEGAASPPRILGVLVAKPPKPARPVMSRLVGGFTTTDEGAASPPRMLGVVVANPPNPARPVMSMFVGGWNNTTGGAASPPRGLKNWAEAMEALAATMPRAMGIMIFFIFVLRFSLPIK